MIRTILVERSVFDSSVRHQLVPVDSGPGKGSTIHATPSAESYQRNDWEVCTTQPRKLQAHRKVDLHVRDDAGHLARVEHK